MRKKRMEMARKKAALLQNRKGGNGEDGEEMPQDDENEDDSIEMTMEDMYQLVNQLRSEQAQLKSEQAEMKSELSQYTGKGGAEDPTTQAEDLIATPPKPKLHRAASMISNDDHQIDDQIDPADAGDVPDVSNVAKTMRRGSIAVAAAKLKKTSALAKSGASAANKGINYFFRNQKPSKDIMAMPGSFFNVKGQTQTDIVREVTEDVYSLAAKTDEHWVESSILALACFVLSCLIFVFTLLNMIKGVALTRDNWNFPTNVSNVVRFGQCVSLLFAVGLLQEDILQSAIDILWHLQSKENQYRGSWGMALFWPTLRLTVGLLAMATATTVIIQADQLIDMFANFAALTFLCSFNLILFYTAKLGLVGGGLQKASLRTNFKIRGQQLRWYQQLLPFLFFVPFILLFVAVWHIQVTDPGALRISLSKLQAPAGELVGSYERQEYQIGSRPVYKHVMLENPEEADNHTAKLGAPEKKFEFIFYCTEQSRYIVQRTKTSSLVHKDEFGSYTEHKLDCNDWIIRSSETAKFTPLSAEGGWQVRDKIRGDAVMSRFLIVSADCDPTDEGRCSQNGKCSKPGADGGHCVCDENHYGVSCALKAPCPQVIFSGLPGSYPQTYDRLSDTYSLDQDALTFEHPVYYSFVPPPSDVYHRVVPGTPRYGSWYMLYYVAHWRRWLIADARKGVAQGGVSFDQDSREAFIKSLFNTTAGRSQISSSQWLKHKAYFELDQDFTCVSEETDQIDPAKINTWLSLSAGTLVPDTSSVKVLCADCRFASSGSGCLEGKCKVKSVSGKLVGKCECEAGFIGPTCATPRVTVAESLLIRWGNVPGTHETVSESYNGNGKFLCARCPVRKMPVTRGCFSYKSAFKFFHQNGNPSFSRPALIVQGTSERTALHLYNSKDAHCNNMKPAAAKECELRKYKTATFSTIEELQKSDVCKYTEHMNFPALELDKDQGEVWNGRSMGSAGYSAVSMKLSKEGSQYANLPDSKAFELQIAAAVRGNSAGEDILGSLIYAKDVSASPSLLKQRCSSTALRRALKHGIAENETPYSSVAGKKQELFRNWKTIKGHIGGGQWANNANRERQEMPEICVKILSGLQDKARRWANSTRFVAKPECGSVIQQLSGQECAQEIWQASNLEWALLEYKFDLAAFDRSDAWRNPDLTKKVDRDITKSGSPVLEAYAKIISGRVEGDEAALAEIGRAMNMDVKLAKADVCDAAMLLSEGMPTSQTSTKDGLPSKLAVDGKTELSGKCATTLSEKLYRTLHKGACSHAPQLGRTLTAPAAVRFPEWCARQCHDREKCGYFAFASSSGKCMLYDKADTCLASWKHPEMNAYKMTGASGAPEFEVKLEGEFFVTKVRVFWNRKPEMLDAHVYVNYNISCGALSPKPPGSPLTN